MLIRVGIPSCFTYFTQHARDLGAPILVSANAFRKHKRQYFQKLKAACFSGCALALDSAGFVAMMRYHGYPWTVTEYVDLVAYLQKELGATFSWWAAMDFCCEPEIAGNSDEVFRRQLLTVEYRNLCEVEAALQGVQAPMPVIQGWTPDDYERCAAMMGDLPELVGVGSVCRRNLHGADGLLNVVGRLHAVLPPHVRLHLFGVKGPGVSALAGHPRIASVDSMAWDFAARRDAWLLRRLLQFGPQETVYTLDFRARYLRRWYAAQNDNLRGVALMEAA